MTAAIAIKTTRYQCPHCRQTRAKKASAEAHIARCWLNPDAKSCKTCAHYEPFERGPYPEHPGFDEECKEGRSLADGLCTGCPLYTQIAA